MKLKILLLILFLNIMCFAQLVKHEYFGMYKYRFDPLKWKVARIDTHWVSKYEHVYVGETWVFKTTNYDTIRQTGEELKYFFHDGQRLTAIQFIKFSYDSLEILKTLDKYSAILRSEGAKNFYPNVNTGGSWPGAGGPTSSLCKVFGYNIYIPGRWDPAYYGTVVVDFAYHYYSIVQKWKTGIEPYSISLNFYPYDTFRPPDPGYGIVVPSKILPNLPIRIN